MTFDLQFFTDPAVLVMLSVDLFFIVFLTVLVRPHLKDFIIWSIVIIVLPILGICLYLLMGPSNYDGEFPSESEIIGEQAGGYIAKVKGDMETMNVPGTESEHALAERFARHSDTSFSLDNSIRVFNSADEHFDTLIQDLENAKEYIHIEMAIFDDDVLGHRVAEVLLKKVREGLEVVFITDYNGLYMGARGFIEEFKSLGGGFFALHPLGSLAFHPKKFQRCHRKMIVIDGRVAHMGSANINRDYVSKGPYGKWKDLDFRLTGGIVAQIDIRIAMDWKYCTGKDLRCGPLGERPTGDAGNVPMQLVFGGRDRSGYKAVESMLVDLISSAKEYVWIQTPYLIPTRRVHNALCGAAESGIDVRVMIPLSSDYKVVIHQNGFSADRLMRHGVKIFIDNDCFLHSKLVIVDGKYCVAGSMNFDMRSSNLDFESCVVMYSREVTERMEDVFNYDMQYCAQYSREEHRRRRISDKFLTLITIISRPLL